MELRAVARFARIPVAGDQARAREATGCIIERRRHLERTPLAELMAVIHEGHRY